MRTLLLLMSLSVLSAPAGAAELLLGDADNGKQLHDKYCVGCHVAQFGGDGSRMYTREDRRIGSIEGLVGRVEGCSRNVGANFNKDQINDVVKYLNDTYYKF